MATVPNRIAGGRFTLDGKTCSLRTNEGDTCLHGGAEGCHLRLWAVVDQPSVSLTLELVSSTTGRLGLLKPTGGCPHHRHLMSSMFNNLTDLCRSTARRRRTKWKLSPPAAPV
ncbi:hypothetical protein ACGFI9_35510 [Micromonospora sp. NPDC048930]|uniref:aldose epimerase family protein n=1 Tax=Micromonospora sp. NPDC048930 TaxID=3364261 RepID=UPI0037201D7C